MRTLLLMRHAKSSWHNACVEDHERALNPRGTRDAPRMAQEIVRLGRQPQMVLCSDAVRTRATLALMFGHWSGASPRVVYDPALYLAEPAVIMERIAQAPAEIETLMVLGHNPGLHALALGLAGRGGKDMLTHSLLASLATRFPTSGLAVLEFPVEGWSKLAPGMGALRVFTAPKLL